MQPVRILFCLRFMGNIRLIVILFIFLTGLSVAQTVVITGNNAICLGQSTTLHAEVTGGSYGTTSYNFEVIDYSVHPDFSGGTAIDPDFTGCTASGHDDCWAGGLPPDHSGYSIGFTFCFFNQQYSKFYVGSNGWIGFTDPTGHSWTTYTATAIPPVPPNNNVPKNCIFAPWQDWFPGASGAGNNVFYYTSGTVPNRKLVVYWLNCPLFQCQSEPLARGSFMIVLNEQSSIIENFIMIKPNCLASNEGATQGVINLAGDIAFTATGRNNTVWTASNEGTRFAPSGIKWYKNALPPGGTFLGYGPALTISPTTNTTYFAVVGTCDGGSASDSRTVTVYPLPPNPVITGPAAVCKGSTWDYTTQAGYFAYGWTATVGNIISTSGNSAQIQWNTLGGQTANVTYQSSDGCSPAVPGSLPITVNPFETPIISGVGEVCADQEATFTTQSGKTNYLWTYPSATLISGGGTVDNSVTLKWATAGTQTVSVNYTDAGGCTGNPPTTKNVIVNPPPVPVISGSNAVCISESGTVFTTAAGNTNYLWTYSPGVTYLSGQGTNTLTVAWNTTGPQWVKVTYTNIKTCTGTSLPFDITVNPLPTASISGTTEVCQNSTSPLITFTGAAGMVPYTFTYKINGGPDLIVSTTTGNSITIAAPTGTTGIFTYTLVSVQDGSSIHCSQPQSGSANITVNSLPTASISGTAAVCRNSPAPLITFAGASGTLPYTFTYKINGGPDQTVTTIAGNSVTVAAPTGTAGTYTYSLVSVQDASTTTCSQSQSGNAVVTVTPLPTASISGTITACKNSAPPFITFTGASATPPYTFTYKINAGADQFVTTVSGNSVSVSAPTGTVGTYIYSLVSVQDGSSNLCTQPQSGNATVTITPLPTASVSGTIAVCQNSASPLITFTGASATPPYTFTYKINGGPDQSVTTVSGNSITVPAPTGTVGTFSYSLVSVQDGSSNACSQSQTGSAIVTVNALPDLNFPDIAPTCVNSSPFPLNTATPPGGTYSGPGVSAGVFSPAIAGVGSHTITYTYTDGNTCVNSTSKNIQVNALPLVDFSGPVVPQAVCQDYPTPSRYQIAPNPLTTFTWSIPPPFTAKGTVTPVAGFPNMADVNWTAPGPAQLKLQGLTNNGCLDSKTKDIIINAKPVVTLPLCFDQVTTTNAKPFRLKGGTPLGAGGKYYIDGTLVAGNVLDPSGLGAGNHTVSFTYTDANTCLATASQTIVVGPSNALYQCVNNTFTDPRNPDNSTNKYPTSQVTANGRTTCWMIRNLNWGTSVSSVLQQTDNCIVERYCPPNDNSCSSYGSLFQWDELMQYGSTPAWSKGVCPPGWHVPTSLEWQDLIDANQGNGIAAGALKNLILPSGFRALLNGMYYLNTSWAFTSADNLKATMFWTSTLAGSKPAARGINFPNPSVSYYECNKINAFPVRCVKD